LLVRAEFVFGKQKGQQIVLAFEVAPEVGLQNAT
jgi:hypothetical protein